MRNVLVIRMSIPMLGGAETLAKIRDYTIESLELGVLVLPGSAALSVLDRADIDDVEVTSDGESVPPPPSEHEPSPEPDPPPDSCS